MTGVKHNTDGGTDGLGGEGGSKLHLDNTVASVSLHNLSPTNTECGSVLFLLCLCDVRNLLAKVEVDVGLSIHSLDLDEGGVVVLVAEATLEAEVHTLNVESARLRVGCRLGDHFIIGLIRLWGGGGGGGVSGL